MQALTKETQRMHSFACAEDYEQDDIDEDYESPLLEVCVRVRVRACVRVCVYAWVCP